VLEDIAKVLEPRRTRPHVIAYRLDPLVIQHLGAHVQRSEDVAERDQQEVGVDVKAPERGRALLATTRRFDKRAVTIDEASLLKLECSGPVARR